MVRPVPYDLVCSCGEFIFTPSFESSRAFVSKHFARKHTVMSRHDGEGRHVVRRFVIRRHGVGILAAFAWAIRDRNRPHWLGHAVTHEEALAKVEKILAEERRGGRDYIPTRREIREAMTPPFGKIDARDEFGL